MLLKIEYMFKRDMIIIDIPCKHNSFLLIKCEEIETNVQEIDDTRVKLEFGQCCTFNIGNVILCSHQTDRRTNYALVF